MIIFQDSFDIYGDSGIEGTLPSTRALTFDWAAIGIEIGFYDPAELSGNAPAAARTGKRAMRVNVQSGVPTGARLPLEAAKSEVLVHFAIYVEQQPDGSGIALPLEILDGVSTVIGYLELTPTGALKVVNEAAATLTTTPANTLVAGTWHSLQVRWKKHATLGVVQILLNNVEIVNLAAQNTGATQVSQVRWRSRSLDPAAGLFWIDDLAIADTLGGQNDTLLGDVRVGTLYMRADDETGWTAHRRTMTGNGQLELDGDASGVTCADNVQFELGSGDFTMETSVKFLGTPTGSHKAAVFSKWRPNTNERSYQLYLGGPALNNSHLQFDISTDGTAGTVTEIASAEFSPVFGHDYHICVQRSGGEVVIFADGVPLCAPQADGNTYHDNTSLFVTGSEQFGSAGLNNNVSIEGFVDEVRITKGVARYNMTGFAVPSLPYARSLGGDADFSSVSLLMGFDSSIADESSFGRAVTNQSAVLWANDDQAPGDYKTVNNDLPRDDSFMEAPYVAASNVLTFSGQPANNDTVTVDGNTYTFKTVFVDTAGFVLIGATVSDSIDNLVAAINGDAGAGTLYGTGTTPSDDASALNIDNDQMRATANTPGTAGNAITSTESGANTAWSSGVTLAGGLDIPGPSSFLLTRLPPQTTGIKAITLVQRARKTDTGDGSTQLSFVTADDSTANGDEHALTTSFGYFGDIIETDPSTSGALTPSSFIGARLRVDRIT